MVHGMKTPPAPVDVAATFPFLRGRERTTWRLHPRSADELPLLSSHIGGSMSWPRGETVPRCLEKDLAPVPVLQLRRDSGLPVPCPDGAELLQILWYPGEYEDERDLPRLLVRYRTLAELDDCVVLEPSYPENPLGFVVQPCSVSPEAVVEYPYIGSLTDAERRAIEEWQEARDEPTYQYLLSTCPGTKVGGYADFAGQDDTSPPAPWEYVLTIADREWDGGSGPRWRPSGSSQSEGMAIGTYLKEGMNVFVDRTQTPWRFTAAR